ncbi:MAG: hypothetical protein COT90_04810 [Candidatus Diapherotrites archaeon CG10_big_fil_rev_8_21_14_0_10_31_34]|nr:MAG: hypothetical protein COT90_04810 [Candidatus Diapherotrites archaeon CG10_big_fil_rev_8_21_14_0_10_31_34]
MQLVEGRVVEQGMSLAEHDFSDRMIELIKTKFSGYVNLTIQGFDGLEEGTLIFREGKIIASGYEYLKYGISVNGNSAIAQTFNSAAAENGVFDIISFRPTDAELTIAVNPKIRLNVDVSAGDIKKLTKTKFNPAYARKVLSMVMKSSSHRGEIMKKLGLGEMG